MTTPEENKAENPSPESILILRMSSLGDVICTLPLLEALKKHFPQAQIDWLVDNVYADLLTGHPHLRSVLTFPRRGWKEKMGLALWEHFRKLREHRYDLVFDVQGNLKSSLNLLWVRCKRSIGFARGFCREGSYLFVGETVRPAGKRIHRAQKNLSLLKPLGIEPVMDSFAPPPIDRSALQRVEKFLERDHFEGKKLALLHPGTSDWGKDKRWPPERFAGLARLLKEDLGLTPIITWGPGELPLAQQISAQSGGNAKPAFETKTLKEFVALISKASLFVAGDTGGLQIASLLGIPSIGLYGPTDPAIYGPLGKNSLAAQPPDSIDRPEHRNRAKRSELMEQISVEQVFQLTKALLELDETTGSESS